MPAFDFRGIKVAKMTAEGYDEAVSCGDAMSANLELRYVEGRLYAESTLAEYMRRATGGTISIGTKYIPDDAQKIMFGSTESTSGSVKGLTVSGNDVANYVGVGFYAPDMVDGVQKYTAVFVYKALFGAPSMSFATMGENIVFSTPTTTGEFLPNNKTDKKLLDSATCDTEEAAIGWINAHFE